MVQVRGLTELRLKDLWEEVMAKEWGQWGIRVNAIAPGVIKTRLSEMLWKEPAVGERAAQATPLLRLGEPEEVASIVLFLASDMAKYVTGETIAVDGGPASWPSNFPRRQSRRLGEAPMG